MLIPYFHNTTLTSQLRIDRVRVCTIDPCPQSVNLLYLTAVTFYQCIVMDAPVDAAAAESDALMARDKGWTDEQKVSRGCGYCDDILLYGCSDPQMDI